MDAILCRLPSFVAKVVFARFRTLPVWLGVGRVARSRFSVVGPKRELKNRDTSMGKVIEFYVPDGFDNLPPEVQVKDRGKVIVFRPRVVALSETDSNQGHASAHARSVSDGSS